MTNLQMLVSKHQAKASHIASQSVDWGKRKTKWLSSVAMAVSMSLVRVGR